MKCPSCGAQIDDDSVFCTECGKGIEKVVEKEEVKAPPPKEAVAAKPAVGEPKSGKPARRKKLKLILAIVIPVVLIGATLGMLCGLGLFGREEATVSFEQGNLYEDEDFGFYFIYPDDWECGSISGDEDKEHGSTLWLVLKDPESHDSSWLDLGYLALIHVVVQENPTYSASEFITNNLEQAEMDMTERNINHWRVEGDSNTIYLSYLVHEWKNQYVAMDHGDFCISISIYSEEKWFKAVDLAVNKIIDTFGFK